MTFSPMSALASVASSIGNSCDDAGSISGQIVWCMLLGATLLLTNFLVAGFTGLVVICGLVPIASFTLVPLLCISCSLCALLLLLQDDRFRSCIWVRHDQKLLLDCMLQDNKERGIPIHSWQTSAHRSPLPSIWRREGSAPLQEDVKSRLLEAGTYKDCEHIAGDTIDELSTKNTSERSASERTALQTEGSSLSEQPPSTQGLDSPILDETSATSAVDHHTGANALGMMSSQLEWWAAESHVESRSRFILANSNHDSSVPSEPRSEAAVKSGTGKKTGSLKAKKSGRGPSSKGMRRAKAPRHLSLDELSGSDRSDTAQPALDHATDASVGKTAGRHRRRSLSPSPVSKIITRGRSSWRRRRASEGCTLPTDAPQLELETTGLDVTEPDMPSQSDQTEEESAPIKLQATDLEAERKPRSVLPGKRRNSRRSWAHAVCAAAQEVDETLPKTRRDKRRSLPLPPIGDANVHSLSRKSWSNDGPDVMAMTLGKTIGMTEA